MHCACVYDGATIGHPIPGDDTDWHTLLKHHDAAVRDFEKVSMALRAALGRYPLSAEFVDLIALEERAREAVLNSRGRLVKLWHDNIDDTIPLRVLQPDHICDRDGPTEGFIGESGYDAIAGVYPTCSHCGMVQLPGGDVSGASRESVSY